MQIKKYEEQHGSNKSTYWVTFELIWRDFFRCLPSPHMPTSAGCVEQLS